MHKHHRYLHVYKHIYRCMHKRNEIVKANKNSYLFYIKLDPLCNIILGKPTINAPVYHDIMFAKHGFREELRYD